MRDVLRAEFPELARIGRISLPWIAREPVLWAFLSGIGAAFLAGAVAQLILSLAGPILFPPAQPRPEWLGPSSIRALVAALTAGLVLLKAGGTPALAAYVLFELIEVGAGLPWRAEFCERSGGVIPELAFRGCDFASLVVEHWPTWVGLAIGAILVRTARSTVPGANWMLRAAGAYALAITAASTALGLFVRGAAPTEELTFVGLFAVAHCLAAVAAGALLARATVASTVAVVAAIVLPVLLFLPLALQPRPPDEPPEFTLLRWSPVYMAVLAAIALIAARSYLRRRTSGTFF